MAIKFVRKIPDAGTPTRTFILEDFLPESWNNVKKLLLDFINNNEKAPIGRTIEGEWGSGKSYITLFLENLINNEDQSATILPVPMGMIHKLYKEDKRFNFYYNESSHIAELLLAAIFIAGYDKGERIKKEEISDSFSAFSDIYNLLIKPDNNYSLQEFVYENIKNLTEDGEKKLYIFIDEMEELIEKEYGNEIFESISALFNESVKIWGKNKRYGGNLRFILACTPEALFKFLSNPQFSEIYGKTLERAKVINLPKLPRDDAYKFLIRSFHWAINKSDTSIEDIPITSMGIIETISRVSQGNFRHLQSFASALVSRVIDFNIEKISYREILEIFPHLKVTDRFGSLPALNLENFEKLKILFENQFGNKSKEWMLLTLFMGEQMPFTINELSERLTLAFKLDISTSEIINIIKNIENLLQKENFSIAPFSKLGLVENVDFENLINKLVSLYDFSIIKNEKKRSTFLKKGAMTEDFDEIQKSIVYYNLTNTKELLNEKVYIGKDPLTLQSQFGNLIKDYENDIINEFNLIGTETYYKLSTDFLEKFFPSPIPITLSYIINDQIRRELWKEVKNQYDRYFKSEIISGFIKCFDGLDLDIKLNSRIKDNIYLFNYIDSHGNVANIKIKIFSHFGIIKKEGKLKEIIDDYDIAFQNKEPYHLAILLHGEDFNKEAKKFFTDFIDLKNEQFILPFRINFNLGRRIIVANLIQNDEHADDFDISSLKSEKKRILSEELDIITKINDLLEKWREVGKLIEDVKFSDFNSITKIFNIFTLFNQLETELSLEKLIENYAKFYNGYKLFYSKIFYFPDLDQGSILSELNNLIDNQLILKKLNSHNEEYYSINNTKIEERIIRILNKLKNFIHFSELENYFVCLSKNIENFFNFKKSSKKDIKINNLFITTLERKGLINVDKNNEIIQLVDYSLMKKNLMETAKELSNLLEDSIKNHVSWIYLYSSGHDKEQKIFYSNVIDYINSLIEKLKEMSFLNPNLFSNDFLKKSTFLKNCQIIFENLFKKYYPAIIQNGIKNYQLIESNFKQNLLIFDELRSKLKNNLNVEVELTLIKDYNEIEKIRKEFESLINQDELSYYLKAEKTFKENFEGSGGKLQTFHFSPKLYYFDDLNQKFNKSVKDSEEEVKEINAIIDKYNTLKESIKSDLVKMKPIEGLMYFNLILEKIRNQYDNFGKKVIADFISGDREISLKEIKEKLIENQKPLQNKLKEIERSLQILHDINTKENIYIELHREVANFLNKITDHFISSEEIESSTNKKEEVQLKYENVEININENANSLENCSKNIANFLQGIYDNLNSIPDQIDQLWKERISIFDLKSMKQKKKIIQSIDPSLIVLIDEFIKIIETLRNTTIFDNWKKDFIIDSFNIPDYNYIQEKYTTIGDRMKDALRKKYGHENVDILNHLFKIFEENKTQKYYEIVNELKQDSEITSKTFTNLIKQLENDGIISLNLEFKL